MTGDFDGDGDSDGFDFLKWQRGESPNPLSQEDLAYWKANFQPKTEPLPPPVADFNGDGSVDDQDLSIWETSFGLADPFGSCGA